MENKKQKFIVISTIIIALVIIIPAIYTLVAMYVYPLITDLAVKNKFSNNHTLYLWRTIGADVGFLILGIAFVLLGIAGTILKIFPGIKFDTAEKIDSLKKAGKSKVKTALLTGKFAVIYAILSIFVGVGCILISYKFAYFQVQVISNVLQGKDLPLTSYPDRP
jgi:hypothetical protein